MSRPCDRCSADDAYGAAPICQEFQLAYDTITWICHDCRKSWMKTIRASQIAGRFARATLDLEHFKMRLGATGIGEIEQLHALYGKVSSIEEEISQMANRWFNQVQAERD